METIQSLPRAIDASVGPTMKAYAQLLVANGDAIRSTRKETFTYGHHGRQTLDVYYPTQRRRPSVSSGRTPVLIFVHGGGFVRGSKTLPLAGGLAHANIGHFFADKHGYTTVIPDYRLIEHGARFPSGGEDVAQVVDWVRESLSRQEGFSTIDLFVMGNSAGGVHLSTYLFAPDFASSRAKVSTGSDEEPVTLRGVVLLSVPFNFQKAAPSRSDTLQAYYGDSADAHCPQGLLQGALLQDSDGAIGNLHVMVVNGTLDPEDEILDPKDDFLRLWEDMDETSYRKVAIVMMKGGHNHISPPLSLGINVAEEEAWAVEQVIPYLESLRE